MPEWSLIPAGLAILIASAEILVRGAAWIALAAGIRPMVVGLTVVAFGTSAPELAASLAGALEGRPGLATGTVLGSNVANIGLILGLAALLSPIERPSSSARFELSWLLALAVLMVLPLLLWERIPRWFGAGLLLAIAWFTWTLVARERRKSVGEVRDHIAHGRRAALLHCGMALAGLAGLPFGASLLLEGAVAVGVDLGLDDQVISAVFVAIGTSLPELAASAMAAWRRHSEIALGNVLGSNIFNIAMVLGAASLVSPLPFTWAGEGFHVVAMLGFTLALLVLMRVSHRITRVHGAVMVACYAGYLTLTMVRG